MSKYLLAQRVSLDSHCIGAIGSTVLHIVTAIREETARVDKSVDGGFAGQGPRRELLEGGRPLTPTLCANHIIQLCRVNIQCIISIVGK